MSNERRERYAAAIQRKVTDGIDLNSILPEVYAAADAAMAVADEEIRAAKLEGAQIVAANYVAENARLRAELKKTHARGSETIEHLSDEVTRLRAELEEMTRGAELWADAHHKQSVSRLDAEATIYRVRAVLDRWRDGDVYYPYLAVRDAVNGEHP